MKGIRRALPQSSVAALVLCLALPAPAGDLYVYPTKGQSAQQQEKDKYECYQWAKGQTGFDPSQAATAPPDSGAPRGGAVRGAARGAAAGAVGGAIAGDAGTGAAVGAATGGLIGGMRRRDQRRSQQAARDQQAAQQQQALDEYNRAYATCLQGRGYTVN